MSTSSFKIAHKLLTGAGAIEQLATELTRLDIDNPLIVTDAALVDEIAPVLGAAMKDALPAATMVVAGLIRPEMKVEIEVTAFRE